MPNAANALAIQLDNDVARLNPSHGGRGAVDHLGDDRPLFCAGGPGAVFDIAHLHADVAAARVVIEERPYLRARSFVGFRFALRLFTAAAGHRRGRNDRQYGQPLPPP